jgi:hypothetical protein
MHCDICQEDEVDQLIPIELCRTCNYAVCMECYYFGLNKGCPQCNNVLDLFYMCPNCINQLPNRNICKKCRKEFHP